MRENNDTTNSSPDLNAKDHSGFQNAALGEPGRAPDQSGSTAVIS